MILFFLFLPSFAFTQVISKPEIQIPPTVANAANRTDVQSVPPIINSNKLRAVDTILFPIVISQVTKIREEKGYSEKFDNFKNKAPLIYERQLSELESQIPIPFNVRLGYDANNGDLSAPLDNSIACSGDNNIITVTNDLIEYHQGQSLLYRAKLSSFINNELAFPCDPKVIFDPTENRFIIFLQECEDSVHISTALLIGFSKSNNPFDGWNFYKLSGNPLNRSSEWFDFPKLGISKDGLFISGNLFKDSIGQSIYTESVVYQIDKDLGFDGDTLKYIVWHDIEDYPFSIVPVSNAYNNTYEKGAYLLSTTLGDTANYYVQLYDITSDIYDANVVMKFYRVWTDPYYYFAKAAQMSLPIDNGDNRMQDAVLSNGEIYYTFTSGNSRNFSRVNFNILEVNSLNNRSQMIGDNPNFSYAYPSLHMLNSEDEKPLVLIQYNGTSNNSFPDIRCKACDENFNCCKEVVIKKGESIICDEFGSDFRWGDYSTIAKNQTEPNQLWLTSSYAKKHKRQTYIANISRSTQEVKSEDLYTEQQVNNPTSIKFYLEKEGDIQVSLVTDVDIISVFDGRANSGENKFEIFTHKLPVGDYLLKLVAPNSEESYTKTFKVK